MQNIKRLYLTIFITLIYCEIWMLLEKFIEGNVTNSIVDNIIMLLFIPVIYIATGRRKNGD